MFKTRQKVKDKTGFYNLYAGSEFSVLIEIHENQAVSSTVLAIMCEGRGGKGFGALKQQQHKTKHGKSQLRAAWQRWISSEEDDISVARNTSYTTNQGGLKFQGRERQLLIPFRKNRAWRKQLMLKHEVHSAGRSSLCRKGQNASIAAQHTTAGRAGKE